MIERQSRSVVRKAPLERAAQNGQTIDGLRQTHWWARQDSNLQPVRYERQVSISFVDFTAVSCAFVAF
jgi:hypothetical protein